MEDIILVRHAAATGQEAIAPLTIDGQRQARALDHFLRQFRIDGVICSPFRRAVESIDPFCRRAGLRVETDPRLVERVLSVRNLTDGASTSVDPLMSWTTVWKAGSHLEPRKSAGCQLFVRRWSRPGAARW